MEKITLNDTTAVFGFQVKSFPEGIGDAFDKLIAVVPDGLARAYYGISYVNNNVIIYIAAAVEKLPGEAEKYGFTRYFIQPGNYHAITVKDWREKTDSIKDVFMEIMKDDCPDENRPCVEWYKNDEEMVCMVRER